MAKASKYLAILAHDLGPFPGVVPLYEGERATYLDGLVRRTLGTGATEYERRQRWKIIKNQQVYYVYHSTIMNKAV